MSSTERLREILGQHCAVPHDDAAPLDLDSLTVVSVVEDVEDAFGIRFAPREVTKEAFLSVAALAELVDRKRSGGAP